MTSPIPIGRSLGALARPALAFARQQWARRGASLETLRSLDVDRELTEALDTLRRDAQTAIGWLGEQCRAQLSGASAHFADEHVRAWLREEPVEQALKAAAVAHMIGEPWEDHRSLAEAVYRESSGDAEWWGGALFDLALAFLAATLDSKTTPSDRVILTAVNANARRVEQELGDRIDRLPEQIEAAITAARPFPIEAVSEHVANFVRRESRRRGVVDEDRVRRVLRTAEQALSGALRNASDGPRADLFRFAAATLAREDRMEEAETWLTAAAATGANDLQVDRARIAIRRGDLAQGLELLRNRSDPDAIALTLDAVQRRDGTAAALAAFADLYAPDQVTGFFLPTIALWKAEEGDWTAAEELLAGASAGQVEENPTLLFVRARVRMAMLAPLDDRISLAESSHTLPSPDRLRDDPDGTRLRAGALADLIELERYLADLGVEPFAQLVEMHRLYFELIAGDQTIRDKAIEVLLTRLSDPATVTLYAWLAFAFDIEFDQRPLRSRLAQSKQLTGYSDGELEMATRLAMQDRDHEKLIAFAREHRDRITRAYDAGLAYGLEIEALARLGRIDEARQRLLEAADELEPSTRAGLEAVIAEETGDDGLAARFAAFEVEETDRELGLLVRALRVKGDPRLGDYAARLWRRLRRTEDAIVACDALFNAARDEELDAFLIELGPVAETNEHLREHVAWGAFRRGDLNEAQARVAALRVVWPHRPSLRQLQINLALEGGEWHRLGELLAEDLAHADQRTSKQLLQAAGLAHATANPIADQLADAAVDRSPDDPNILVGAFELAVRRGRDWEPKAGAWLRRAVELSDDSGPMQTKQLRDLIQLREEGAKRSIEFDRMIMSGEIPLGLAVGPLNTTLSELILGRLEENTTTRDGRLRFCLPVIAGNRLSFDLSSFDRVALDPGAILILQLAGLLPEALEAFPSIIIPAGTLPLLFSDLTRSDRRQPSRIAQAKHIRGLLASGKIQLLSGVEDGDEDEDDISVLYARARALDGYVMHTAPLYEPGSLLERVRDPAPFVDRLISPHGVIAALAARGEIGTEEAVSAKAKLVGYGAAWPDEPAPDLARPIIVHATALNALEYCGVLEPLLTTGAKLHAEPKTKQTCDGEVAHDEAVRALAAQIENVRATLLAARTSGRARLGPFRRSKDGAEVVEDARGDAELTPILSLLQDGAAVDLLVSADRMMNCHAMFTDRAGASKPIATPVDVINHLAKAQIIDESRRAMALRKLREAGVALIPITADEVEAAAGEGDWSAGASRSLRAILHALHLPLLRRALVLPDERHWLEQSVLQLVVAIRRIWARHPDLASAVRAAGHLFLNIPNLLAIMRADESADAEAWATGTTASIYALLALPLDLPRERVEAYHDWFEELVAERLDGRDRAVKGEVLRRLEGVLRVSTGHQPEDGGTPLWTEIDARRFALTRMPRRFFAKLLERQEIAALAELPWEPINVDGHIVDLGAFAAFIRSILSGDLAELRSVGGEDVASIASVQEDGSVTIETEKNRLRVSEAGLFSDQHSVRVASLEDCFGSRSIAPAVQGKWRDVVTDRSLSPDQFRELIELFQATPEAFAQRLDSRAELDLDALVVMDPNYYRNLLDMGRDDEDLASLMRRRSEELARPEVDLLVLVNAGPLAVSPDFSMANAAASLSDEDAARLCEQLCAAGDPFSALAAFDLACARPQSAALRRAGSRVLELLTDEGEFLFRTAHDFCVAAVATIQLLEHKSILSEWLLPLRRCAMLTHAGHAARVLRDAEIERPAMFRNTLDWAGGRWILGGLVDRCDGPEWQREWLNPEAISGHVLLRIDSRLAQMTEEDRPAEWSDRVKAKLLEVAKAGEGPNVLLRGPLDEFSPTAFRWPLHDGGDIVTELATAEGGAAFALIYQWLFFAAFPQDQAGANKAIIGAIERTPGPQRLKLCEAALAVADRWRVSDLADRIVEALKNDRIGIELTGTAWVNVAIASAAAATSAKDQAERLSSLLETVAFDRGLAAMLPELATSIDVLSNLRPAWSHALERIRSAAMLVG